MVVNDGTRKEEPPFIECHQDWLMIIVQSFSFNLLLTITRSFLIVQERVLLLYFGVRDFKFYTATH